MSDPWFDPNRGAWIPGTVLGVVLGIWGGVAGWLAPHGKGRTIVVGGLFTLLAAAAVLLALGVIAYVSDQPYGVWYGLGLAGLIGVLVLGGNAPMVLRRYREADARKLDAQDL